MFQFTFKPIVHSRITNKMSGVTDSRKLFVTLGTPVFSFRLVDSVLALSCIAGYKGRCAILECYGSHWEGSPCARAGGLHLEEEGLGVSFPCYPFPREEILLGRPEIGPCQWPRASGSAVWLDGGPSWAPGWVLNKPFKYIGVMNCKFICILYNNLLFSSVWKSVAK